MAVCPSLRVHLFWTKSERKINIILKGCIVFPVPVPRCIRTPLYKAPWAKVNDRYTRVFHNQIDVPPLHGHITSPPSVHLDYYDITAIMVVPSQSHERKNTV